MSQKIAQDGFEFDPPFDHQRARQIIYLACPYTDPNIGVREARFREATRAAAVLIGQGYIVYSPITMTHPIDLLLAAGTATMGSDYWVSFDEAFLDACSSIVVLKIDGWEQSSGDRREIEYFSRQGKPVHSMRPLGSDSQEND